MSIDVNDVAPRRNPGLIDRILGRTVRADPQTGPQPELQETTQTGVSAFANERTFEDYFHTLYDRKSTYNDVDEMDNASEEVSTALDTIADNATSSEDGQQESFRVVAESQDVQDRLEECIALTGLHELAYTHVRNLYKYGDIFTEIIVNANLQVSKLRILPVVSMFRNQDKYGDLRLGAPQIDPDGHVDNKQGECAFEQRDPQTDALMATFWPYQILHGRWNWDGVSPYGRSGLRVTRVGWRKLHAEEESLILGRLIRAMMKLAFYVDTTGRSQPEKEQILKKFQDDIMRKTTMSERRDTPWSVLSDFFFSSDHYKVGGQVVESKTRVEAIDPKNDGLTHIDDIEYFHRKMSSTARVPRTYMGFDKDAPAAGAVSMQDIQFVRVLRRIQTYMSILYSQLFKMSLVLADIDPNAPASKFKIEWPVLSTVNESAAADAAYKLAQAGTLWLGKSSLNQQRVLTPDTVMKQLLNMSDDEIADQMKKNDAADQEEQQQAQAEFERNQKAQQEQQRMAAQIAAQNKPKEPNAPREDGFRDNSQSADPEKAKQGSNTAEKTARQEVEGGVLALLQEVRRRIDPEIERVAAEQRDGLAEVRELRQAIAAMPSRNGHADG